MRRGHSDLRLDRRVSGDGAIEWQGGNNAGQSYGDSYYFYKNPRYAHEEDQKHLKELVHTQEQLEPQRYKTIIFLSGR